MFKLETGVNIGWLLPTDTSVIFLAFGDERVTNTRKHVFCVSNTDMFPESLAVLFIHLVKNVAEFAHHFHAGGSEITLNTVRVE